MQVSSLSRIQMAAAIAFASLVGAARLDAQTNHESCRPDGLYKTSGVNTPYCQAYDSSGREKMAIPRRIIGYFPSWRTGTNGQPRYLVKDIPFGKVTHINYAFGHIENNRISVGPNTPSNPATGMTWPGVAGAEMDPAFSYNGHFNLFSKFKKQYPQVKTLISVGGWAETGGYFDASGNRVSNGGFYTLVDSQSNINTFADSAVAFLRQYNFDGIDIDFEYASSANFSGNPDDFSFSQSRRATLMTGYVNLMRTLRQKLDAAAAADGRYYMLTAATSASGWILRGSEAYQVNEYLDYANLMTYDLHGAWNHFVGPNAALYDDGQDAELAQWGVYGAYGIGYLNTDWAYHYFRGSMPAGRINVGVPYYTRGWRGVTGGVNGLWGRAALPNQSQCPPGTGSSVGSTTPCGNGAVGIDNLWADKNVQGGEVPAGANPMWHAKNLERGINGSYLGQFGLDPVNNPEHRVTGTYQRFYNSTLVTPWLWNASKGVFLSTEDEQSLGVKADYIVNKGIGGAMFWELSADFNCPTSGECGMGEALTTVLYNKFRTAPAYGAAKSARTMPTSQLNVAVTVGGYPVGDSNYPITPKVTITNNSTAAIPGGAVFEFDYATSCMPATLADQSGFGTSTVTTGHSGNNTGAPGLRGDFHHARFTLPSYITLAPGANTTITMTHQLPTSILSNWTIAFGGTTYAIAADWPRGATGPGTPTPTPTVTPTGPTPTPTPCLLYTSPSPRD